MMTQRFRGQLLLLVGMVSATCIAQTPDPLSKPAGGPIALNVVVTPDHKNSEPLPQLPQSAFTVLDNGKPQTLTSFHALTGKAQPVKTFLVVDAINISFTRLAYEREEIEKYLKAHEGQLASPTVLAVVSDTSTEATPNFTTDGNQLSQVLDSKTIGLRDLRRSSGFYGAEDRLDLSLRALQNLIAQAAKQPGNKAIVWVSPGWPLLSGPNVQLSGKQSQSIFQRIVALSTQMRTAHVTLYGVDPLGASQGPLSTFYYEQFLKGVRKPSQVALGDLGLQVLAVQSGGLALSSSNDIAALLQRCADDTKASYEITYAPPPADAPNEYHEIQVKVAEPHLLARTRQGYYSQP